MNNKMRIGLGTAVAVVLLTVPLFLLPVSGVLITACLFGLLGVASLTGTLLWTSSRTGGRFVTTAAFPLAAVRYLITDLLLSITVILLQVRQIYTLPAGWFCFLHLLIAGFFAWKILAMDAGKAEIEHVEVEVKERTSGWKMLQQEVSAMAIEADGPMKKSLASVRDAIRYADPMTSPRLAETEDAIRANVVLLGDAVKNNDIAGVEKQTEEILRQIRRRAELCKLLK